MATFTEVMSALYGSSVAHIERERANGNMITLCPNCGRTVHEDTLRLVNGKTRCPGDPGEDYCADPVHHDVKCPSCDAIQAERNWGETTAFTCCNCREELYLTPYSIRIRSENYVLDCEWGT